MQKLNTIIIPCIRSDYIGKMLETLYKYTPANFNVIVIDQTIDNVAQNLCQDKVQLWIKSYRNLGFAKAMNTGILLANTPYITLANDDLEFMNATWWQGIIDTFAMDPRIIAVNPMSPKEGSWGYGYRDDNKETWQPNGKYVTDETKLSVYPKKLDGTGFFYKENFSNEDYDFLLNHNPCWSKDSMCDAIAMWCTVFKKEGLEEIGLLDERFYPGGGEDYDMCCRAYSREKRMVGTTKSWVWHHWGKSKDDMAAKNPTDKMFTWRPRWNANEEVWGDRFDVWGHYEENGIKKPLVRIVPPLIDEL